MTWMKAFLIRDHLEDQEQDEAVDQLDNRSNYYLNRLRRLKEWYCDHGKTPFFRQAPNRLASTGSGYPAGGVTVSRTFYRSIDPGLSTIFE